MSGSLGSVARIGLTYAGYALTGGSPLGALAGSLIGSYLFPGELPGIEGPRLGPDQGPTTSAIGAAIPIVYGTIDVNGSVIQDLGRVEIKNTEEVGGKGAPSQEVTNYTYTRTYAVLLCDCSNGRPLDGVLRIWRNAKLVYDIRVQQEGESDNDYDIRVAASEGFAERFNLYLGTADQLPDPVLEAAVGVGLQPAYRHRAYIVFVDEDVTDNSGRTSQWKFEVVCDGNFSSSTEMEYAQGVVEPWVFAADPRNSLNTHVYSYNGNPWTTDLSGELADMASDLGFAPTVLVGWARGVQPVEDAFGGTPYITANGMGVGIDPNELPGSRAVLQLHYTVSTPEGYLHGEIASDSVLCSPFENYGLEQLDGVYWDGYSDYGGGVTSSRNRGCIVTIDYGTTYPPPLEAWQVALIGFACNDGEPGEFNPVGEYSYQIAVRRQPGPPTNPCAGKPALPENPDFCVLKDGSIARDQEWALVEVVNGFKALQTFSDETSGDISRYPVGPVLPIGHEDDTEAYWEAAYDAAVLAGTVAAGKTYNAAGNGSPTTTYPVLQSYAYAQQQNASTGVPLPVTLASIVSDLCTRKTFGYDPALAEPGLTQDDLDVSDLLETVQGYRVDRVMTRRQAIEPLMRYGYFDCVDGAVLKFPTRGKAVVAALDEDTLAAHEAGSAVPPLVEPTNVEDVELPRFIGVRYPMPHADYQVGMQGQPRATRPNSDIQYLDMPIAMSDAKAAQISEVLQSVALTERERYTFSVSPRWLALEAADNVTIPLSGETQRVMLTSVTGGFPGPLKCEAVRSDPSDYLSTAAGVASNIAGQQLGIAGLTVYALIDGPAFDERQDDPGFYVAAYGTGTRWRGASLYESVDDGDNYTRILSVSGASTMGVIESALPVGPHHIWDEANTLTVTLGAGTLESRTEAAVLAGANAAFVGADGRWELIQFRTATLVSPGVYTLSGFLRGRRGTEWAIGESVAGDTFVLCTTLQRVPKGSSAIGATRLYKMVTSRTLLENSAAEAFSTDGVALECYAPAQITASRDVSGNITFTIVRRARLGPEWIDYADVPLNEDSERYQIDVLDGATVVRTLDSTTDTMEYSALDQVVDLGFGAELATLEVPVVGLFEMGGYYYGVTGPGTASIRSYGADFELVGGNSLGSPAAYEVTGLANDGTAIFVSVRDLGGSEDGLYRFEPSSGAPGAWTHRYTTAVGGPRGVVYLGGFVWFSKGDIGDERISKLDPDDLTELDEIDVTSISDGTPQGLATDGVDLFLVSSSSTMSTLSRITTAGSITWTVNVELFAREVVIAGDYAWVLGNEYLSVFNATTGALVTQHRTRGSTASGLLACNVVPALRLMVRDDLVFARSMSGGVIGYSIFDPDEPEEVRASAHNGAYFAGGGESAVFFATGTETGVPTVTTAFSALPPEQIDIVGYQLSATVGRGYPTEATV